MDEMPITEANNYEAKAFAAFGTFEELGDTELQVKLGNAQNLRNPS